MAVLSLIGKSTVFKHIGKVLKFTSLMLLLYNMFLHNMLLHNMFLHNMLLHNMLLHNMLLHNMLLHNMLLYNIMFLQVWEEMELKEVLKGHSAPVWDVAIYPGAGIYLSASGDKTIRLWRDGENLRTADIMHFSYLHNYMISFLTNGRLGLRS